MSATSDTLRRCWDTDDPVYREYHDAEWGRPLTDERPLFEKICLEGFQSGLSWAVVLRKRPAFREVFAGFDPERVARLGPEDVDRLVTDERIIRNRRKIEATIANAEATLALRDAGTPLDELVWSFLPAEPGPAPASFADLATDTPESNGLSKALKRRGFRFVGPTTMYALLQAAGLVNDHFVDCFVREEVGREQAAAHDRMRQRQRQRQRKART
jgi:DNA-3-methyladenine glycosylase I